MAQINRMMDATRLPLSVLDLAKYVQGATVADAFRTSRDLAQHAERLGYRRFWLAEHHGLEGIASAATAVLLAHLAEHTKNLRVGSGGIMLPNHAPLIIAEQFGTLATLFPGRIDLGLGRAPGSDQRVMRAIRGPSLGHEVDFGEMIDELVGYFAPSAPGQRVRAIPAAGVHVPIWILGSSLYSARLAARLGRPYAFAGHFAPAQMYQAFETYRREFQPSEHLTAPYTMAGVPVVAAETDAEAEFLATSVYQMFLGVVRGHPRPVPPPVENMDALWSPQEAAAVNSMMRIFVVGGPSRVRAQLQELVDILGVDELIITSDVFDHAARLRSFELITDGAPLPAKKSLAQTELV